MSNAHRSRLSPAFRERVTENTIANLALLRRGGTEATNSPNRAADDILPDVGAGVRQRPIAPGPA
jgi:hypothetical protein